MSNDQESKFLAEESAQENDPQKLLEIVLSLAAAIHEQQAHGKASAVPAA